MTIENILEKILHSSPDRINKYIKYINNKNLFISKRKLKEVTNCYSPDFQKLIFILIDNKVHIELDALKLIGYVNENKINSLISYFENRDYLLYGRLRIDIFEIFEFLKFPNRMNDKFRLLFEYIYEKINFYELFEISKHESIILYCFMYGKTKDLYDNYPTCMVKYCKHYGYDYKKLYKTNQDKELLYVNDNNFVLSNN